MKLRLRQSPQTKHRLSATLRGWLPILQSGLEDLEKLLQEHETQNPLIQIRNGFESSINPLLDKRKRSRKEKTLRTRNAEVLEALTVQKESLFDLLYKQINAPLFPTPKSETIAYAIMHEITDEGYFTGDSETMAGQLGVEEETFERIRQRFAYLEPPGVGARDALESLRFQLVQSSVEEPLYSLVERMLEDFEGMNAYRREPLYDAALRVIRSFTNPPGIETLEEEPQAIPDLFIFRSDAGIEVTINDAFYPVIEIEESRVEHQFIKNKLKEGRDLVDALEMRKATLHKIGLMIVELQFDFFMGGELRPMRLKDIAEEFDHNPSTISRAIANKYLMCDRGLFPLKAFFAAGLDEEVSNTSIKSYIKEQVSREDRGAPLSDNRLVDLVTEKFGVKLVRRTVTKYRKQLGIGSSSERKRLYQFA